MTTGYLNLPYRIFDLSPSPRYQTGIMKIRFQRGGRATSCLINHPTQVIVLNWQLLVLSRVGLLIWMALLWRRRGLCWDTYGG